MSRRKTKISLIVTAIATLVVTLIFFGIQGRRGTVNYGEWLFWGSVVFMLIGVTFSFARALKQSTDESTKN